MAHIPPNRRTPYWSLPEKEKEDITPLWQGILKYSIISIIFVFAAWIIFGFFGILINDFGDWAIHPLRHFKHLFNRARFIPINSEFIQLMCWAVFIGWVIYRIKCENRRRK